MIGSGSEMRLIKIYEDEIQQKLDKDHEEQIYEDQGWDFNTVTGERENEFQENINSQNIKLKVLTRKKKHNNNKKR